MCTMGSLTNISVQAVNVMKSVQRDLFTLGAAAIVAVRLSVILVVKVGGVIKVASRAVETGGHPVARCQ